MLTVSTPLGLNSERIYVLNTVLSDWLGLEWQHKLSAESEAVITVDGCLGELRLPDTFWSSAATDWLERSSLPAESIPIWPNVDGALKDTLLIKPDLPVLFGDREPKLQISNDILRLPIDIFGSAFFMLSRYEEAVLTGRDDHERFPGTASIAFRGGFLDRPIIDEYIEVLWSAMKMLWPSLERRKQRYTYTVSCDVDLPFMFDSSSRSILRKAAGQLARQRSLTTAISSLRGFYRSKLGDYSLDPYRSGIDFMMEVAESFGKAVAFYFIPDTTHKKYDGSTVVSDPRIRRLMSNIVNRGHEVGIHPGYNTYLSEEIMGRSVQKMREALESEGISCNKIGGRQHYLRWSPLSTPQLWEKFGLAYDSTLSYADKPGFRCGTCKEYSLFDLQARKALQLREKPLIIMDSTIFAKRYMGHNYDEHAAKLISTYRDKCRLVGGEFTMLWHNSELVTSEQRDFFTHYVFA